MVCKPSVNEILKLYLLLKSENFAVFNLWRKVIYGIYAFLWQYVHT